MNANPEESASSPLSAEETLAKVQELFAQLQLLPGEVGTNRHSAAYAALEAEIRVWADRYSRFEGPYPSPARKRAAGFQNDARRPNAPLRPARAERLHRT